MNHHLPPKWALQFFAWICRDNRLEDLEGDLYELFEQDLETTGKYRARWNYIVNMFSLVRFSLIRNIFSNSESMDTIFHYLRSAFRTFNRQRSFSLISLSGLVIAFAVTLLVGIYAFNENSFDTWRTDVERLYRVYDVRSGNDEAPGYLPITPPVFATELRGKFPEVEMAGRVLHDYGGTFFKLDEDNGFQEEGGIFAEPEFLGMFDVNMIKGSLIAMDKPDQVLLSQSLFEKFFGNVEYGDQQLIVSGKEVAIAGIYEDFPLNSHLRPEYIFSLTTAIQSVTEKRMNSWVWQPFYTYVKLKDGMDKAVFEEKFQAHIEENAHPVTQPLGFYYTPYLQSVTDIHLQSSHFEWEIADRGNGQALTFIVIAAGILLVIAIFNFVNLFAVQTIRKLKEISIRRAIGALKSQITIQLLVHTSVYMTGALVLAAAISYLVFPKLEMFLERELDPYFIFDPLVLGGMILLLFVLTVVATMYPILLSRKFEPVDTIKGLPRISSRRTDPRMILVGIQYILGVGLIFTALVVNQQFSFLREKDMGFDPDQMISFNIPSRIANIAGSAKQELLKHSNIEDISVCYGTPGDIVAGDGVRLPNRENPEAPCNMIIVDHDYIKTFKMEIVAGRDFRDSEADRRTAFIINETAMHNFGFETPEKALGQVIHWNYWGTEDSLKRGEVIGVVRDFNFTSLHNEISPVVLHMEPDFQSFMAIRMGGGAIPETIAYLENWWKESGAEGPLPYNFVDDLFAKEYRSEQQLNTLFIVLTIIAILMAATGIFSLVAYNVNTRLREISIRKVLGAGTNRIFGSLMGRYLLLSLVTLAITLPLSSQFIQTWLNNYAYRVEIGILTYLMVGIITMIFTLVTVGSQAWNAARKNPVSNLRSE